MGLAACENVQVKRIIGRDLPTALEANAVEANAVEANAVEANAERTDADTMEEPRMLLKALTLAPLIKYI